MLKGFLIATLLVAAGGRVSRGEAPGWATPSRRSGGEASFNAGAGMAKTAYAASYIHDNMPFGINYQTPVLTVQQAWDVAAYMISKPHPPAPPETASALR
jgi:cytochrome c